jgi:hypothetical protein
MSLEDKFWLIIIAVAGAGLAASFVYRGEAISQGYFIDRYERPGCFWMMTGLVMFLSIAALARALLS